MKRATYIQEILEVDRHTSGCGYLNKIEKWFCYENPFYIHWIM